MLPYQPPTQTVHTTTIMEPTTNTTALPTTTKTTTAVVKPPSAKPTERVTVVTDRKQSVSSLVPIIDPKWSIRKDIKSRLGDIGSIDVSLDNELVILHSANRPLTSE